MNVDVFISHHVKTSGHIAQAIANKLESMGIRCWYCGRDMTGGDYATNIMLALNSCKVFLLILNRAASESEHVLNELDAATVRLTKHEPVTILPFVVSGEEITLAAQYYLRRHHWIDAITPPMYARIDALAEHVVQLMEKNVNGFVPAPVAAMPAAETVVQHRIISRLPQTRDIFHGREEMLAQIEASFASGKRVLFLEGIGGIGKSELAKQYAMQHCDQYDNVVFLSYVDSLESLLCDATALQIEGVDKLKDEEDAAFAQRKLSVFKSIADGRTLLIVDNFDVDNDPLLKSFADGSYHVIFTTRNAHAGFSSVKVGAITDEAALLEIFTQNYEDEVYEDDLPAVREIFRMVEGHTYTIELIAKQMAASYLSASEMLDMLQNGALRNGEWEEVAGRDDWNTAIGHICSLFNTSNLSEEEKQILMYLSLMGIGGVPAQRFRDWASLSNMDAVNRLIRRSWVRKESGQKFSLHPMVREVVHKELVPTVENCRDFLRKMDMFCFAAWFRPYVENLAVANNVLAVLSYFQEIPADGHNHFSCFSSFLWQVGYFTESIANSTRVYEACVKHFGVNSMYTGFQAQMLGGCYFNASRVQESIRWYKQGLESMLQSGAPVTEDLAMSYEKVARCYTWEYEQDFEKAEELFQKSLAIREEMLARVQAGEDMTIRRVFLKEPFDEKFAYGRLCGIYMEIGRMYQFKGDWENGCKYARLHLDLRVNKQDNASPSSVAYANNDIGVCLYHMAMESNDPQKRTDLLAEAQEKLEQALETNMKMRGALAYDTIDNQEYLADVYAAQGDYLQASNGYMAVLTMTENLLGPNDPRIARVKEKMCFA